MLLPADLFARPGSKSGGAHAGTLVDGASYWLGPSPAAAAAAARGSTNSSEELRTAQLSWLKSAPRQGVSTWQWHAVLAAAALSRHPLSGHFPATPAAPIAHVVCNANPPTDGQPALLSLNDASTLFQCVRSCSACDASMCTHQTGTQRPLTPSYALLLVAAVSLAMRCK